MLLGGRGMCKQFGPHIVDMLQEKIDLGSRVDVICPSLDFSNQQFSFPTEIAVSLLGNTYYRY